MDGETIQITVHLEENLQELLIAELAERGFEAFEQDGMTLRACTGTSHWSDDLETFLNGWIQTHAPGRSIERSIIPNRNWNEAWEASIKPVEVGRFLVTPGWKRRDVLEERDSTEIRSPGGVQKAMPEHEANESEESGSVVTDPDSMIVIEIDPKMSFGTGHHASTRLALRLLESSIRSGDRVLDAGCGTGILAIAAARLGARFVLALDNDPWAFQNCMENVGRNGVADVVAVRLGDDGQIPDETFDLVLANLQLSVIREMMPSFDAHLAPDGRIILSGLIEANRPETATLAANHGYRIDREEKEDEWYAASLVLEAG